MVGLCNPFFFEPYSIGPDISANSSFSADSRLLVSSSKDTTLKVWDVKTGKLHTDLPGHQDEVFAVDWSPDGRKVASGGKDKVCEPLSGEANHFTNGIPPGREVVETLKIE